MILFNHSRYVLSKNACNIRLEADLKALSLGGLLFNPQHGENDVK